MRPLLYVVTVEPDAMAANPQFAADRDYLSELAGRPCRMLNWRRATAHAVASVDPLAIIHSGGAAADSFPDEPIFHSDQYRQLVEQTARPQLAVCRAFQVITTFFGGRVAPMPARPGLEPRNGYQYETGLTAVEIAGDDPLWRGLPVEITVHENHRNEVTDLPPGFALLARSRACANQTWRAPDRLLYGVQFHPERGPTDHGTTILRAFFSLAERATTSPPARSTRCPHPLRSPPASWA